MSDPARRGLGCVFKAAILVLVLVLLLPLLASGIGSGPVSALIAVAFGWVGFLQRTLPEVGWNWDLVSLAALCVAGIAVLGHKFATWLTSQIATARATSWRWRWRWTWCGLAAVGLLFLVGMSIGGAAHQIGWVIGSHEPWYELRPRQLEDLRRMRELDMELQAALTITNTVTGVRQRMWNSDAETRSQQKQRSLLQSFHILLITTNRERVDGIIIFPRSTEARSRLHGYVVTDSQSVMVPMANLPEMLKERQPHLIAF